MSIRISDAVVYNAGFNYADKRVTIAIRVFNEGYDPYHSLRINDIDNCSYTTFELDVDGNEALIRDLNSLMSEYTIFQLPQNFEAFPDEEKARFLCALVKLLSGF